MPKDNLENAFAAFAPIAGHDGNGMSPGAMAVTPDEVNRIRADRRKRLAQRLAKGSGLSLIALSVAACAGSDDDDATVYSLADFIAAVEAGTLAEVFELTIEPGSLGAFTVDAYSAIAAAVGLAVNAAEAEAAITDGTVTFDLSDSAEAILAFAETNPEDVALAVTITVTGDSVALTLVQFEDLADLGATFAGAVTVSGDAEAILATEADLSDVAVSVTGDPTLSVAQYEELVALGAVFAGAVTVADSEDALLAASVPLEGLAIVVTGNFTGTVDQYEFFVALDATFEGNIAVVDSADDILASDVDLSGVVLRVSGNPTLDVAEFEALLALGATFAGNVTIADSADSLLATEADLSAAAVIVTGNPTLSVEQHEALLAVGATFAGNLTVSDSAANILGTSADLTGIAVVVTGDSTLSVADYEALLALDATFAGSVTVSDSAANIVGASADLSEVTVEVAGTAVSLSVDDLAELNDIGATFADQPEVTLSIGSTLNTAVEIAGVNDLTIEIGGTAAADDFTMTLNASGTGAVTFAFTDEADDVTLLAGSTLSGFTSLTVVNGTVDVTSADLGGITEVTMASGVVMTAAQFLALDSVEGLDADSELIIEVATEAEADAVLAAVAKIGGTLAGASVSFVAAPGAQFAGGVLDSLNDELDAAIFDHIAVRDLPESIDAFEAADDAVAALAAEMAEELLPELGAQHVFTAASPSIDINLAITDVTTDINAGIQVVNGVATIATLNRTDAQIAGDVATEAASLAADVTAAQTAVDDARTALVNDLGRTAINNYDALLAAQDVADAALTEAQEAFEVAQVAYDPTLDPTAQGVNFPFAYDGAQSTVVFTIGGVSTTIAEIDALGEFQLVAGALSFDQVSNTFTVISNGAPLLDANNQPVTIEATVLNGIIDAAQVVHDATLADNAAEAAVEAAQDSLTASANAAALVTAQAELGAAQAALATAELAAEQPPSLVVTYTASAGATPASLTLYSIGLAVPVTLTRVDTNGDLVWSNSVTYNFNGGQPRYEISDGQSQMYVDPATYDALLAAANDTYDAEQAVAALQPPYTGSVTDDYDTAIAALDAAEQAVVDFDEAVAEWEALNDRLEELEGFLAEAVALEGAYTNALAAIEGEVDGLGINVVGLGSADAASGESDLFLVDMALYDPTAQAPSTVVVGGQGPHANDIALLGADYVHFDNATDTTYSFVELGADDEIIDAVGSAAALEIFAKQVGNDVELYIENIATAGNGSNTQDIATVTLTNVSLADLSFDASTSILTYTQPELV